MLATGWIPLVIADYDCGLNQVKVPNCVAGLRQKNVYSSDALILPASLQGKVVLDCKNSVLLSIPFL
jgi:hypothetical protein